MARQFCTIPSTNELKEINDNKHFTDEVKKGMLKLHKADIFVKEAVMRAINTMEKNDVFESGYPYVIQKVEIVAPHDVPDADTEYINDTIQSFNFDGSTTFTTMTGEVIKEAFLIQLRDISGLCFRYAELYDVTGEKYTSYESRY